MVPLECRTLVEGLDHPEGVARGPDGRLWAGGEAGQLYVIGLEGTFEQVATTSGFVTGLALDQAGRIYACDIERKEVLRIDPTDGTVAVWSTGTDADRMVLPNYPVFDNAGNLYVTDSGDWDGHNGRIFRISPAGATTLWSEEPTDFPNQLCLDSSGEALLVIESTLPGLSRIPITSDGRAGGREIVVVLPETVPDGVATNADGSEIFVSCYRPDRIYCVRPNGEAEIVADDPFGVTLNQPTSLAFVGEDLDKLAIANLGGWHVSIAQPGTSSGPVAFPHLP